MPLREELTAKVRSFVTDGWDGAVRDGRVVPDTDALTFSNSGVRIEACVLYADIHQSTAMVDAYQDIYAAEYYKSFLHCASKVVSQNGGAITAFDGDRIMAVYVGNARVDSAVRSALQLHWVIREIINPVFAARYITHRHLHHTVGIDAGLLMAAKTGIRSSCDLVWVGACANYAAKLNSFQGLDVAYPTRITHNAYALLSDSLKGGLLGNFWDGPYSTFPNRHHYRTSMAFAIL